jgi:hypothetical protein
VTASSAANGTQTATITTEHVLGGAAITTPGTYQLVVDLNAMLGGSSPDILELRVYSKALSGGTERVADVHAFTGAQTSSPLFVSKPYMCPAYIKFTLKQTAGTGRSFPWSANVA